MHLTFSSWFYKLFNFWDFNLKLFAAGSLVYIESAFKVFFVSLFLPAADASLQSDISDFFNAGQFFPWRQEEFWGFSGRGGGDFVVTDFTTYVFLFFLVEDYIGIIFSRLVKPIFELICGDQAWLKGKELEFLKVADVSYVTFLEH